MSWKCFDQSKVQFVNVQYYFAYRTGVQVFQTFLFKRYFLKWILTTFVCMITVIGEATSMTYLDLDFM
jgi:hypothetical protein